MTPTQSETLPAPLRRVVHELTLSERVFRDYSQQHRDKADAVKVGSREHSERMRKSLRNFERADACKAALDGLTALQSIPEPLLDEGLSNDRLEQAECDRIVARVSDAFRRELRKIMRRPKRPISFAWTPGTGSYYPPYVNLTGNKLTVRGSEGTGGDGHPIAGISVSVDLPDEAIADFRAALSIPRLEAGRVTISKAVENVIDVLCDREMVNPMERNEVLGEQLFDAIEAAMSSASAPDGPALTELEEKSE